MYFVSSTKTLGERAIAEQRQNEPGWITLLSLSILSVYAYVALEWLFFATKPSFMSSMGIWDQVAVGIVSPLAPALIKRRRFFSSQEAGPTVARILARLSISWRGAFCGLQKRAILASRSTTRLE